MPIYRSLAPRMFPNTYVFIYSKKTRPLEYFCLNIGNVGVFALSGSVSERYRFEDNIEDITWD